MFCPTKRLFLENGTKTSQIFDHLSHVKPLKSLPVTYHLPTIYAVSTGINIKSATALIRISGSQSKYIFSRLTRKKSSELIPRKAILQNLYSTFDKYRKNLLDNSIVIFFPHPNSFTGEDVLELHLHGGKTIIKSVLNSIDNLKNYDTDKVKNNNIQIKYAEPGEFSRRSFLNGKKNLIELESIKDLIDSETEKERQNIIQNLDSQTRNKNISNFKDWRNVLIDNYSELTAVIDFNEDMEINDINNILRKILTNFEELAKNIKNFNERVLRSNFLLDGIKILLIGSTNVGKSSLINKLVKDDVAIVSNIPGTTRDLIEKIIEFNGWKLILTDSAGINKNLRSGKVLDEIEKIGIKKSISKLMGTDISLLVVDGSQPNICIDTEVLKIIKDNNIPFIVVVNKFDLIDTNKLHIIKNQIISIFNTVGITKTFPIILISCKTDYNIEELYTELTRQLKTIVNIDSKDPIRMSYRVQNILREDIIKNLDDAINQLRLILSNNSSDEEGDAVIICEVISEVINGINKITGESVGIEEVLDTVFSKFCIGK
ncbi:hypothetical protein TBLA_0H02560 [Henningerozyma blattae CBS 6284]|uniref:Guanylate kinase-like domain-containing protein n=1 Tax=Henningerozyma blattae (strain ATCC 34711 / CBS 6284 / DSM 70876 / NBRC 10599 / NRRL Y-10934 / UCD 77-7) TaxID=1071380 RepID=I2H838_HENB6|nr:hypothetical protein TBLA_0H02560 [Tetrapisispora blattae CBS 6284]CCH62540.1 hypothetical protein TBLA_0H02560 [Tetrapisispora blattae CBS 6284]